MLTLRQLFLLAVPSLLVVACGNGDEEPAGTKSSGAPTDVVTEDEIDYPEDGVDLVDPPVLEGVYQRGLQTYVDFERGRRLAARDGRVGRLLSFNATARVVDPYRAALASYDSSSYDGGVVIEFLDAQARGNVLRIDICVDATALQVPDAAPVLLGEATRAPQRVDVSNIEGLWRVTRAEPVDGTC